MLLLAGYSSTLKPAQYQEESYLKRFSNGFAIGAFMQSCPPFTGVFALLMLLNIRGSKNSGLSHGIGTGFAAMAATQLYVGYKIYQKFR